jgi:hypothetical protein
MRLADVLAALLAVRQAVEVDRVRIATRVAALAVAADRHVRQLRLVQKQHDVVALQRLEAVALRVDHVATEVVSRRRRRHRLQLVGRLVETHLDATTRRRSLGSRVGGQGWSPSIASGFEHVCLLYKDILRRALYN